MSARRPRGLTGWGRSRSVRARLTAAAVVVIAVSITLSAVLLTVRLESALVAGVDRAALDRAERVAAAIASGRPAESLPAAGEDEVVHVLDENRAVLASSVELADGRPLLRAPAGTGLEVSTQQGLALPGEQDEPYRVLTLPVVAPDGRRVLVQVGLPLDDAEESVEELTSALAIGAPAVVVVLALLTWLLGDGRYARWRRCAGRPPTSPATHSTGGSRSPPAETNWPGWPPPSTRCSTGSRPPPDGSGSSSRTPPTRSGARWPPCVRSSRSPHCTTIRRGATSSRR